MKIKLTTLGIILFSIYTLFFRSVNAQEKKTEKKEKKKKYKLPNIDLSHWSVTTPQLNEKEKQQMLSHQKF